MHFTPGHLIFLFTFYTVSDVFAVALPRSHYPLLLQQIKAQGGKKSGPQSVLGSKLVADMAQLKQKSQGKKTLSGMRYRDKEVSPCHSKHGHRSQGNRRESGGHSDTGTWFPIISSTPCKAEGTSISEGLSNFLSSKCGQWSPGELAWGGTPWIEERDTRSHSSQQDRSEGSPWTKTGVIGRKFKSRE